MSFVHLHTHTHYSLLESSCRVSDLIELCEKYKMPAAAITDNGNMFGVIDWYNSCKKHGIKPIIGMDVYIAVDGRFNKKNKTNTRLVLLAKSYEGYQELCKISTTGYREGFYYKPRIDYETLQKYSKDLICLTGGMRGEVVSNFLTCGKDRALERIDFLKSVYHDNIFLEMQNISPENKKINEFLFEASESKKVPLVATNDVYFTSREDHLARDVLCCIGTNRTLDDRDSRFGISKENYFKSPDEMKKLFSDFPKATDNSLKIANMCNFEIEFLNKDGSIKYNMPTFKVSGKSTMYEALKKCAYEGLEKRFVEAENLHEKVNNKDIYYERMDSELKIINSTGFVGYFLIVQDFINWAKQNNIPVGPGRGSGAGSLVAYSLMITDLDPIKHDLIFERFLNSQRVSIPDFDIDFCRKRRSEVIEYVVNKYGSDRVSQIMTYGKLQARAAIRDVGRVLSMEYSDVDDVARLIPEELGITISSALEKEPRLVEMMEEDPKINQLINTALQIEGLNRHVSVHAAGIIISNISLFDHAPLYKGKEGETIIQYDMRSSESMGLVKFDFLGLKTLTYINRTFELIKKHKGKDITTKDISLHDEGIYKMISSGSTAGIFQFESAGITELILRVKPTSFDDITAINALYRPGPMRMLDEYISRKHDNRKIKYMFKELEDILKSTYGIIVYQEQVQLIAYKIANYSLGEADILRRAMGKKNKRDMQIQKKRFINGALQNGYNKQLSEELFDLMARFAEYGFNKSHAAAYCVITAQTAWLKKYYPLEFYTALLSAELGNISKIIYYIRDAKQNGITIKPPCINKSEYDFSIVDNEIYFGLGAIKMVGKYLADKIVETREKLKLSRFNDVMEFFEKVDPQVMNKKSIEQLILSGSFDCFDTPRDGLMDSYTHIMSRADKKMKDRQIGQGNLFDGENTSDAVVAKEKDSQRWSRLDTLLKEKNSLGFFFTDHPLKGFEKILKRFAKDDISKLNSSNNSSVRIGGIITNVNERVTRKAKVMAFVSVEDLTGTTEVVVFSNLYSEIKDKLKDDSIVFFESHTDDEGVTSKVIADKFYTLDQVLSDTSGLCLNVDAKDSTKFVEIREILKKHKGSKQVVFRLSLHGQTVDVVSNNPAGVDTNKELINELFAYIPRLGAIDVF